DPDLEIEYYDGTGWQTLGWAGASSYWYGDIGRDAWFIGRDGSGGVPGYDINADLGTPVPIRVNFPNGTYNFTTTVESTDSADEGALQGSNVYLSDQAVREIVTVPDELQVSLAGLSGSYFQGDAQTGSEQAQFTFVDNGGGNIGQIFNVFLLLDDTGTPVASPVYDQFFAGFTSNPADYIRGLSGTSPANVVAPQTVDVDLLFGLQPEAPVGDYSIQLTSYDVTGVDPNDVSLTNALAGDYPVLDSAQSGLISVADATGEISGSVTVNGVEGGPQPGEGVTVTAERDSDGYSRQTTVTGGNFTIAGLPQGSYTITASQPGFVSDAGTATLASGNDTEAGVALDLASAVAGAFTSTVSGTSVEDIAFESGETLTDVDLAFARSDAGPAGNFHVSLEVYDAQNGSIDYTDPGAGIFTATTLSGLDIGPDHPFTVAGGDSVTILDGATIELGPNADRVARFEYSLIDERYPSGNGRINHQSTNLFLDIQPIGEIAGNVTVSGIGAPDVAAEGYTVTASRDGSQVASAVVGAGGGYTLQGLSAGTYTVEVDVDGFAAGSAQVSLASGTDSATQDFQLQSSVTGGFSVSAGGNPIAGQTFPAGRVVEDVDLSIERTDGGPNLEFYVSLTVLDSGGAEIDYNSECVFTTDSMNALGSVLGPMAEFTLTGNDSQVLLQDAELELCEGAENLDVQTLSFRLVDDVDRFGQPGSRVVHVADGYNIDIAPADTLDVALAGFEAEYEQGDMETGSEQVTFNYSAGAGDVEQVFNVFTVLENGSEIPAARYADLFDQVNFPDGQIRGLSGTDPSVITAPGDLVPNAVEFVLAEDAPLGDYELVITSYDVTGIDPNNVSLGDTGSYRQLDTASRSISLIQGPELQLSVEGQTVLPLAEEGYFAVRLQNTGDAAPEENVEGQFSIARTGIAASDLVLDYCTDSAATSAETCGSWTALSLSEGSGVLTGRFGPAQGFPVPAGYDATTYFRAAFSEPGNYSVTDQVVSVDSEEVLASIDYDLAVSELTFTLDEGVDGTGADDSASGWDYYTATLSNLGDALPENVALWVEVDGIDAQVRDSEGYDIEYWNGTGWENLGWAQDSYYWDYDRDAWFLGRPSTEPSGPGPHPIPGFPVAADEDFVTPIRVNFDNDSYDLTVSVETADQNADPIWVYGQFEEAILVESDPVELSIDTVEGLPSGMTEQAGYD
ncbi:carboxypeptidase-like regulatory domain-containing protein, partial [Wenzhouxiangella sediminis]